MKKHYFKTLFLALGLVAFGSSSLVSCSDYDDDITRLETENKDALESIAALQAALDAQKTSLEATLEAQKAALEALISAADDKIENLEGEINSYEVALANQKTELLALIADKASAEDIEKLEESIAFLTESIAAQKTELEALINGKADQAEVDALKSIISDLEASLATVEANYLKAADLVSMQEEIKALQDAVGGQLTADQVKEIVLGYDYLSATEVDELIKNLVTQDDINASLTAEKLNDVVKAIMKVEMDQINTNKAQIEAILVSMKDFASKTELAAVNEKLDAAIANMETALASALKAYVTIDSFNATIADMTNGFVADFAWEKAKVNSIEHASAIGVMIGGPAIIETGDPLAKAVTFDGVEYPAESRLTSSLGFKLPVLVNPNGTLPANGVALSMNTMSAELTGVNVVAGGLWTGELPVVEPKSRANAPFNNFVQTIHIDFENSTIPSELNGESFVSAVKLSQTREDDATEVNEVMSGYDFVFAFDNDLAVDAVIKTIPAYCEALGSKETEALKITLYADSGEMFKDVYTISYDDASGNAKFEGHVSSTPEEVRAGIIKVDNTVVDGKYIFDDTRLRVTYNYMDYNGNVGQAYIPIKYYAYPAYGADMKLESKTVAAGSVNDVTVNYDLNELFATLKVEDRNLLKTGRFEMEMSLWTAGADSTLVQIISSEVEYFKDDAFAKIELPVTLKKGKYNVNLVIKDKWGLGLNKPTFNSTKVISGDLMLVDLVYDFEEDSLWWTPAPNRVLQVGRSLASGALYVDLTEVLVFNRMDENPIISFEFDETQTDAAGIVLAYDYNLYWNPTVDRTPTGVSSAPAIGKEFIFTAVATFENSEPFKQEFKVMFMNPIKELKFSKTDLSVNSNIQDDETFSVSELLGMTDTEDTAMVAKNKYNAHAQIYGTTQFAEGKFAANTVYEFVDAPANNNFKLNAKTGEVVWDNPGAIQQGDSSIKVKATTTHIFGKISTSNTVTLTVKK